MKRQKVVIVGAGNVGATAAYFIAKENIADVLLLDVVEGLPQSKGLDFSHTGSFHGYDIHIRGTNDFKEIKDADIIVHTAGIARKPGMDRMDLLKINVGIVTDVSHAIRQYAPNALVVVVANPLDIIALACLQETGFPSSRVFGMAGVLDSTRLRYFIAEELNVLPDDVFSMVLGGHGDTMVPLPRYTTVAGIPLTELLSDKKIKELSLRTQKGGAEIVNYLKTGSAYYAPAASTAKMVITLLHGQRTIIPVSVFLNGEYGQKGIFLGLPVILGPKGIEKTIELSLNKEELSALQHSAEEVQKGIEELKILRSSSI